MGFPAPSNLSYFRDSSEIDRIRPRCKLCSGVRALFVLFGVCVRTCFANSLVLFAFSFGDVRFIDETLFCSWVLFVISVQVWFCSGFCSALFSSHSSWCSFICSGLVSFGSFVRDICSGLVSFGSFVRT